ncbi:MAG: hypothetical protein CL504_09355 [Actinobacteria bacterium]|nr:hypothetical protein [Actinomycetota bacterium]
MIEFRHRRILTSRRGRQYETPSRGVKISTGARKDSTKPAMSASLGTHLVLTGKTVYLIRFSKNDIAIYGCREIKKLSLESPII